MKTINLNISAADHSTVQQIKNLGVLRVESWIQTDTNMQISLHERTWGEWWGEIFYPKKAAQAREAAAEALERAVNIAGVHPQLAQNIRDKINLRGEITGAALAQDFARVEEGKTLAPVKGGAIAADNKGKRVDFIRASPQEIRCEHAILRDQTVSKQVVALYDRFLKPDAPKFTEQSTGVTTTVAATFKVEKAATYWTCIKDTELPDTGHGTGKLTDKQLKDLFRSALEGKSGSVVMEPFPDEFRQLHGEITRNYSEEGLQAQLEAAREAIRKADGDLVITFASEDEAILKKLREMHLEMESVSPVASANGEVDADFTVQLSNRRMKDIAAQEKVTWKLTSDSRLQQMMSGESPEEGAIIEKKGGGSEITGWMTQEISTPKDNADAYRKQKYSQMAWAYRQVLAKATTTVAIAPIEDIPFDEQIIREQDAEGRWSQKGIISCSDDSIELLLEAILEARETRPELKVIIACAEYPDAQTLSSRIGRCIEEGLRDYLG